MKFIFRLKPPSVEEAILQEFVYNRIYLARSSDLAVSVESGVVCGKRACQNRLDCGFIPNYPIINFGNIEDLPMNKIPSPKNRWTEIENCRKIFSDLVG